MTIWTYFRGHKAFWSEELQDWVYFDTEEIVNDKRPCKKCGESPTPDGYDACIGNVEGVEYACCGHGVEEGYVIYEV